MNERILKEKGYFMRQLREILFDMEANFEKYFDVVQEDEEGQIWVEISDVTRAILKKFEEKKIWRAGLWVEGQEIESVEQLDELQDPLLSKIARAAWEVFGPYAATIHVSRNRKDRNIIHVDLLGGFEAAFHHLYEFRSRAGLDYWRGYHVEAEAWVDGEGVEQVDITIKVPR